MKTNMSREDQLVGALCHASALVPLMGIAVPLVTLITQGKRSAGFRLQAAQALAYQIMGIVAYLLLTACSYVGMFAFFPLMFIPLIFLPASQTQVPVAPEQNSLVMLIVVFVMIVFFLFALFLTTLQLLGGPLYLLCCLIAAWRVLRGSDFHYPILGGWISRRLNQGTG